MCGVLWIARFRGTLCAVSETKRPLTPHELNAKHVLATLMRVLGIKDEELARRVTGLGYRGLSRSAIQQRRTGTKALDVRDIFELARALEVPVEVFDLDPVDLLRWLADNRAERVLLSFGWTTRQAEADQLVLAGLAA